MVDTKICPCCGGADGDGKLVPYREVLACLDQKCVDPYLDLDVVESKIICDSCYNEYLRLDLKLCACCGEAYGQLIPYEEQVDFLRDDFPDLNVVQNKIICNNCYADYIRDGVTVETLLDAMRSRTPYVRTPHASV
jgi:hypothetical protein